MLCNTKEGLLNENYQFESENLAEHTSISHLPF